MSMRRISLITAFMVLPATLLAQRGGAGGFGRDAGSGGGASGAKKMIDATAEKPTMAKDLEKMNPIEMLLDMKKDIKMTDDEQKELKSMNSMVRDSIKPFLKTIDSTQKEMGKTGDYAPTEGQMLLGRKLLREMQDSVRAKYMSATATAMSKLSEDKRASAADMLKKEQDKRQQEAMAARKGGRGTI